MNNHVDKIYRKIWEVDSRNVQRSHALVAHIPPGVAYTGTSVEATLANLIQFMDYTEGKLVLRAEKTSCYIQWDGRDRAKRTGHSR